MGVKKLKTTKQRSDFLANTIRLVRGDVIAQIIMISLTPVITRLYLPEAFGSFSIFVSVVAVIMAVSHLRYNVAIHLPKDENDADSVTLLGLVLVAAISLLALLVVVLFSDKLSTILKIEGSRFILYLVPVGIFLGGINMVLSSWHLRMKGFKRLALTKVTGAVGNRATMLALGFQGLTGPGGLVIGKIVGQLFSNFRLMFYKGPRQLGSVLSLANLKNIKTVALRYKEFPKYSWSSLLKQTSRQMPVFFLGYFFTPAVAGYYALCRNILSQPTILFAQGLAKNFYQKTCESFRSGRDISANLRVFFKYVVTLVFYPMTLFCLVAVETFTFVFGPEWQEVGLYAQVLTPMLMSNFLWRPFEGLFDLLEKQKEMMLFSLFLFVASVSSLAAGSLFNSPLSAVAFFSCTYTAVNLYRTLWIISRVGIEPAYCAQTIAKVIVVAALFLLPVYILKTYLSMPVEAVIASLLCSVVLYYSYVYMADAYLRNLILSAVRMRG